MGLFMRTEMLLSSLCWSVASVNLLEGFVLQLFLITNFYITNHIFLLFLTATIKSLPSCVWSCENSFLHFNYSFIVRAFIPSHTLRIRWAFPHFLSFFTDFVLMKTCPLWDTEEETRPLESDPVPLLSGSWQSCVLRLCSTQKSYRIYIHSFIYFGLC